MYCVSYVIKDWDDNMLLCRHDASFTGAIFDSIDEIKQWASEVLTGRGYITMIEDIYDNDVTYLAETF